MGANKVGIEHFKYNKHSFRIEYPVKPARPTGNARKPGEPDRWQFVSVELEDYMQSYDEQRQLDADITVGQLKINMMTATDTEKENHARQSSNYLHKKQTYHRSPRPLNRSRKFISHCEGRLASLVRLG